MADTVKQLNSAREICLRDVAIYSQVVPGILPVITQASALPVRRWGADFLAETFASPVLNAEEKQRLVVSTPLLDILQGYIGRKEELGDVEDNGVVKSAVQCAASIYPLVFRHSINSAGDPSVWNKMLAIKSGILRHMDSWPAGVRICCVKFLSVVVLVQTPGLIADPRRPEQNEVSLALLGRDHPYMKVGILEAEASGLLDRVLGVLQDDGTAALLVTATINSLASLVQRRASISNKIINAITAYNPLQLANKMSVGRNRVYVKSMTRTTISFLINILKRNPQQALGERIKNQINRLRHGLDEAFADANHLKRSASDDLMDGFDMNKRQRMDQDAGTNGVQHMLPIPPLPQGPITLAQLFTLPGNTEFNVTAIPGNIVAQLVPALVATIDKQKLDWAVNAVRGRFLEVSARGSSQLQGRPGDDDEYDPSSGLVGESERVLNELDMLPPQNNIDHHISVSTYKLAPPPALSQSDAQELSIAKCVRLLDILKERDREEKEAKDKGVKTVDAEKGWNATAPELSSREGWLRLLIRMAITMSSTLADGSSVKLENGDHYEQKQSSSFSFGDQLRHFLFTYIIEDFRRRINDAIRWLSEEWYAEQRTRQDSGQVTETVPSLYTAWSLRLLDAMVPYLDVKDNRILIRFFSETPQLSSQHLDRLIKIAEDPERVNLAVTTLLYLVMYRPPTRELALDALERLWKENEDAKPSAQKYLVRWRPHVIETTTLSEVKVEA